MPKGFDRRTAYAGGNGLHGYVGWVHQGCQQVVPQRNALPRPLPLCHLPLGEAVDKFRRWETKTNPQLKGSKWIWLKDQSNYTDKQQAMYDKLMACNLKIAKVWAVKEQFRTLIQQEYDGDMEAYLYFSMWFDDAIALKSSAMEAVAFTFKRHLKGIVRAMVTKANNGKAERMNGSIQEIRTIGRGYATAKRFRTAILFFYGDLDLY